MHLTPAPLLVILNCVRVGFADDEGDMPAYEGYKLWLLYARFHYHIFLQVGRYIFSIQSLGKYMY